MLSRILAALILVCGLARAQPDAAEIVEKAFAADEKNDEIARMYTFRERQEVRRFNSDGKLSSTEVRIINFT